MSLLCACLEVEHPTCQFGVRDGVRRESLEVMHAVVTVVSTMLLLPALATYSCERVDEATVECTHDDDCGLAPAFVSCCVECAPAPPFEAVTRDELDALWLDLEARCAESSSACVPVTCPIVAPGCVARAVCDHGRCRVVEAGCEHRIAGG